MISCYMVIVAMLLFFFACLAYLKTCNKTKKTRALKGDYQVVVVVNKDLNMSKGKTLSQFGHAIDFLHEKIKDFPELEEIWRNCGSAKIALKGTQDDLNKVYYDAKKQGVLYGRIYDAGRTQVKSGSNTVIFVGPATKEMLEPITGYLKLY